MPCSGILRVVRVATYNIRHAQGLDALILPRRIASTLATTRAQVVGLQEVWHVSRGYQQTELIAGRLGMACEFAEAHRHGPLQLGNSVLTSGTVVSRETLDLPGRRERRVCLMCELEVDGTRLRFACTHLALHRATRAAAIEMLAEKLPSDLPLVLVGDFNASAAELKPLEGAGLTVPASPPPSFPSLRARSALDHIAFSAHWELEELVTVRSIASDHLPVVAELRLR